MIREMFRCGENLVANIGDLEKLIEITYFQKSRF